MKAARRRAFTLVELLVVVGIIAVLISMLMPALRKVREQSQLVACQSNMKQFGNAYAMYVAENKRYPNYNWPLALNPYIKGTLISDNSSRYPGSLADAGTNNDPLKTRPMNLLHCPSVPTQGGSTGVIPITLTYAMNGLSGNTTANVKAFGWAPLILNPIYDTTYPSIKPNQVKRSAQFGLMTEMFHTTSPHQSAWTTTSWRLFVNNEFSALFPHNRFSNVLFADYHVAAIRYNPVVSPSSWSRDAKTGFYKLTDGNDAMFHYDSAKNRNPNPGTEKQSKYLN